MNATLTALKDIPGVEGSFVLNRDGALAARELPAIFNDAIFPEIARRLDGIRAGLESQVAAFDDMVFKFETHWLYTRRLENGTLLILTTANVNFPALKMASNLASKQITEALSKAPSPAVVAKVESAPVAPAPAPAPVKAPEPEPVAAAPAAAPKKRMMWRGQMVEV
jgi:predicted regulator of Ras-like GTPase activity (Roadblock/LC7/MglB family)